MSADPHRLAAEIYETLVRAQREAGGSGDEVICAALEMLAEGTGKNSFRHAGAFIRGTVNGRPSINDAEALRRIGTFPPARQRDAIGIVAREVAGANPNQARVDAIAHRLRRKLRKIPDKRIMSIAPDA